MISDTWMEDIDVEVHNSNQSIEAETAQITSDTQANDRLILQILEGIDFFKSRLPQEFLGKKKNPDQIYGDFQLKINKLIQKIAEDNELFEMDITAIDRYLFLMAKMLAGAIQSGCQGTASAARVCLTTGFSRVRANCLVLQNEESRQQYLDKAVKYLNNCYLYISVKNMMDITEQNLQKRKKRMQKGVQQLEDDKKQLASMILQNPALISQIQTSLHTTFRQSGSAWSLEMHQLYEQLVQLRISESNLHYENLLLDIETKKMFVYQDIASKLKSIIATIPAPVDVKLGDKYQDTIRSSFEEAEKVDRESVQVDDAVTSFEDRLQSMSFNGGWQTSFMTKTYQSLEESIEWHPKGAGASDEDTEF